MQALKGIRILCIDGHIDTLEILQYMLELNGAEVLTETTGAAGIRTLIAFAPRIVISDVCLPDDDAQSFMCRVHKLRAYQTGQLGVIAVSAHCTERDRRLALTSGFARFVQKPFDEGQILEAIEFVLYRENFVTV
jgi:two-component system, OmpR family, response regulator